MTDTSGLVAIGRFSALTRISVRMLRHYDANGVLVPAWVDQSTGYRWYAPDQLADAMVVRQLRDVGFGVPVIGALVAARGSATFASALEQQRAVIVAESRAVAHRLDLIDRMRQEDQNRAHHKENDMSITFDEHPFLALRVVALRETIPTYADESALWERFVSELQGQGLFRGGVCGAVDHDEEYQESDVDKEVFLQVPPGATAKAPLVIRDLPEQRTARATYTGPYDGIGAACDQLVRWATDHGLSGVGGMIYVYRNDVRTTPAAELLTEIYLPVA